MRIGIIGAGAAGLAAARHVSEEGFYCEVFEMGSNVGGTWIYNENTGEDEYGFPIYGAMYKNLRANLPKDVMSYPDFPSINKEDSYLYQSEILEYLNLYADHFKLRRLIRFNRMITEVLPLDDGKWQMKSIDKPTKQEFVGIYDAVMICNGHYNVPFYTKIHGEEKFKGKISHSHLYRVPDPFTKLRVLVIGAGPSGFDISTSIAPVAQEVILSHHSKVASNSKFPPNVTPKPDVLRIKDGGEVEFIDSSSSHFDAIVYCTGYNYSFPFLHDSCGVNIDDNWVQPLYKHMVHIDRPTMCFIGIPSFNCAFPLFDLQSRFFCKYLKGGFTLPSPEEMRKDTEKEMQKRWEKGYSKRKAHFLGPDQQNYYEELADVANIKSFAPVYSKLWFDSERRFHEDFLNFRKDKYKVLDDENFILLE